MEKRKLRLATTHIDRHGERFSIGALETMVEQSNKQIIPLGYEHDPRVPPLGRVIKTELIELEDGEFAVEGIAEIFDNEFVGITDTGNREIPVRTYDKGIFKVVSDRNFRDEESKKDIEDLKNILNNAKTEEEIKKSLDPITILTIGGAFVLGGIATGFLGEIGADAHNILKEKLKNIFKKPKVEGQEKLFTFDTTITSGKKYINVEVIITNPTSEDIQKFFDEGIRELDQVIPGYFLGENNIKRIVFEYKTDNLKLKFALLKNGIPIKPK